MAGVLVVLSALLNPTAKAITPLSEAELWAGVKEGRYVAMMRHALAPGSGDPENFHISDCSTQRNLSKKGRKQSLRIGTRIKSFGITSAAVYTSQWCRCRETARLLGLGPVTDLAAINSFWRNRSRQGPQTRRLRGWLKNQKPTGAVILVTHYINILALSGYAAASGEIVIIRVDRGAKTTVIGTIHTDA
ncbi:MAG: histidine phosphatase family protein [Rhodospirillaceae bacterium]|nr:histidine phosphatase family protein [Rhodospirillaceae bacterium]MCY4311872.1 histidine phosphatase family protein [Rhodospirillaceae bacterium]